MRRVLAILLMLLLPTQAALGAFDGCCPFGDADAQAIEASHSDDEDHGNPFDATDCLSQCGTCHAAWTSAAEPMMVLTAETSRRMPVAEIGPAAHTPSARPERPKWRDLA